MVDEEIDTVDVVRRISSELEEHHITQKVFADRILDV